MRLRDLLPRRPGREDEIVDLAKRSDAVLRRVEAVLRLHRVDAEMTAATAKQRVAQ